MKFLSQIIFKKPDVGVIPLLQDMVSHGFSWGEGSKNMSFQYGEFNDVLLSCDTFLEKNNMKKSIESVLMVSEHSDRIVDIEKTFFETNRRKGDTGYHVQCDAFFTEMIDVPLLVKPADCTVSIIFGINDLGRRVSGLVHAGMAGLDKELPQKVIQYLVEKYRLQKDKIFIGVVPGITEKNYYIKSLDELKNNSVWFDCYQKRDDVFFLDFQKNIFQQYLKAGILENNIQIYTVDTYDMAKKKETFSQRLCRIEPSTTNGRFLVAVQL